MFSGVLANDAVFNTLAILVDVYLLRSLFRGAADGKRLRGLLRIGVSVCLLFLVLPYVCRFPFGHRAIMRFFGMALFWHLPVILLFFAAFKRSAFFQRFAAALLSLTLISTYIYAYWIEPHRLEVTHYTYTSPAFKALKHPLVIAQIGDIQTEFPGKFEERVFQEVAKERPHVVLYNGDFAQAWTQQKVINSLSRLAEIIKDSGLNPPLGSYAVIGDVDREPTLLPFLAAAEIQYVKNQCLPLEWYGLKVNLVGLDLFTSRRFPQQRLNTLLAEGNPDAFNVFFGHAPDYAWSLQNKRRPFLALAGHTHGGQVQLPFFGPLITYTSIPRDHAYTFRPWGSGYLSVSRCIGMERMEAPRLRFCCRPEIRFITLMPPEQELAPQP